MSAPVLTLARLIAPRAQADWLEAMSLETPFILGRFQRVLWYLNILRFAWRLRLEHLGALRTQQFIGAATLAAVALLAMFVYLPQGTGSFVSPPTEEARRSQETTEEAFKVTAPADPSERARAAEQASMLEDEPGLALADADAFADDAATGGLEAELAPPATPSASLMQEADTTVTQLETYVETDTVTIELLAPTRLELFRGTGTEPDTRITGGALQAGTRLEVEVPFTLSTANAGGISTTVPGLAVLGKEGETQQRVFLLEAKP